MARRIKEMGIENEQVNFLEEAARKSVDKLPLNTRDHLCCGNSAVVEYYLSTGECDAAGRILLAVYKRKCMEGWTLGTESRAHCTYPDTMSP